MNTKEIIRTISTVTLTIVCTSLFGDIGDGYTRKRLAEVERKIDNIPVPTNVYTKVEIDAMIANTTVGVTNSQDGTFQDRRIQIGNGAEASGKTIIGDGTTNRLQSIALGLNAKANGATSIAIGSGEIETNGTTNAASADGSDSIAIGYKAKSAGKQSVAIGDNSKALDSTAIAIGNSANAANNNSIAIGTKTDSTNSYSVVIGHQASSSGNYSLSIGHKAQANKYNVAIGMGAVVSAKAGKSSEAAVQIGAGTNTTKSTIQFLNKKLATEDYVTENFQPKGSYLTEEADPTVQTWAKEPNKPTYTASEVGAATPQDVTNKFDEIGPVYASPKDTDGHIQIGIGASAGRYSVVVGAGAEADGTYGVVVGLGASTSGKYGTAIGFNAKSGTDGVSLGHGAAATNESSIAIGVSSKARDIGSIAIGNSAISIDTGNEQPNIAIGQKAEARGNNAPSISLGVGAVSKADNSVQIGAGTNTTANTIQFFDKKLATENYVDNYISATNTIFSNAVLSVGINTNELAAVHAFYEAFSDIPISPEGGGITLLGILGSIATVLVWLRNKKIGKVTCGSQEVTAENGEADVTTFFSSANTALNLGNIRTSASDSTTAKAYIDGLVGDINDALDTINGEVV